MREWTVVSVLNGCSPGVTGNAAQIVTALIALFSLGLTLRQGRRHSKERNEWKTLLSAVRDQLTLSAKAVTRSAEISDDFAQMQSGKAIARALYQSMRSQMLETLTDLNSQWQWVFNVHNKEHEYALWEMVTQGWVRLSPNARVLPKQPELVLFPVDMLAVVGRAIDFVEELKNRYPQNAYSNGDLEFAVCALLPSYSPAEVGKAYRELQGKDGLLRVRAKEHAQLLSNTKCPKDWP